MALSEEDKIEIQEIFIAETKRFYDNLLHGLERSGREESSEFAKLLARPVHDAIDRSVRNIESKKRQQGTDERKIVL